MSHINYISHNESKESSVAAAQLKTDNNNTIDSINKFNLNTVRSSPRKRQPSFINTSASGYITSNWIPDKPQYEEQYQQFKGNSNTVIIRSNNYQEMVSSTENHTMNSKDSYDSTNQTLQIVNDVVARTTPDNRVKQDPSAPNKKLAPPSFACLTPTSSNAPTTPITPCTPMMTVEELKQAFRFDENLTGDSFPVACRSAQGTLYKSRLGSGKKGRCIKVNNDWMTPWEFESLGGRSGSKDWKRSIRYQGRPINDLMMAGFISFHAPSCTCRICSDDPNGDSSSSESQSSSASVRYFTPYKRKAKSETNNNNTTKLNPANNNNNNTTTGLSNAKKLKTPIPIAPSPSGVAANSGGQRPILNSSKSLPASSTQHNSLLTAISSASGHDNSGTLSSTPISQVAAIGGGSNTAIYLSNLDQNIQNQQQQHHMHTSGTQQQQQQQQQQLLGHSTSNGINMSSNILSGNHNSNNASTANSQSSNSLNNHNSSSSSLAALVPALESISNQITHLGSQVDLILSAVKKDLLRDASPQSRGGTANGEIINYIPSGSSAIQLKNEKVCNNCGRETTSMCSGCNKAYYCSDFCIQKDWGNHANYCDVQPILTPASPQKMQGIFGTPVLGSLSLDNNSKPQQNSNNTGQTTQIYLATGSQHQQSNSTQIINASNNSLNAVGGVGGNSNANSAGQSNSTILLNSNSSQGMQLKQLNLIPNSLNSAGGNSINTTSQNDNSLNSRNSSNDLNQDQIATANNVAALAGGGSNSSQQFLIQTSTGATLVIPANFLSNVTGTTTIPIGDSDALESLLGSAS